MGTLNPDRELAREKYRLNAPVYDRVTASTRRIRRECVERLRLQPGDVVFDIACGTGLSFPLIEDRIGSEGRIVGVDLSPDMLARARERLGHGRWQNVTLVESAVEDAQIPAEADAVLFHFAHDIMRSPAALENVFRHVRPGARVVSAGAKWAPWWALPVNVAVWRISRHYVTTFEGFAAPWSRLARYLPDLRVKSAMFGGVYITWGTTGAQS